MAVRDRRYRSGRPSFDIFALCGFPTKFAGRFSLGRAKALWRPSEMRPYLVKNNRRIRIETLAVHAGHTIDAATGAVSSPIHLSTTFERDAEGGYPHGYVYARSANPTRHALEEGLAALEGGVEPAAFGSGLAASSAILQALA